MEASPSKRRKTPLSISIPTGAPTTPSRIPVRTDGAKTLPERWPSFASPTKASIARHNPQLLSRPSSAGTGAERSGSVGRSLDGGFARALGPVRPSIEGLDSDRDHGIDGFTTQENEVVEKEMPNSQTPKTIQTIRGGLSAKPRRMSHSSLRKNTEAFGEQTGQVQDTVNPFKKAGLRRSPIQSQVETVLQENINPFEKRGLRRSPISSQPLNTLQQGSVPPEVPATPTANSAPLALDAAFRKDPSPLENPDARAGEKQQLLSQVLDPFILKSPARQDQSQISPILSQLRFQDVAPASLIRPTLPEEPELPPTPTERGIPDPIVTTPPAGIHNTPSKRSRRENLHVKKLKSSPLKPRDVSASHPARDKDNDAGINQKDEARKTEERRRSARFVLPRDPYAAKKKVRDDLLNELQKLREDVAIAKQEHERLRQHCETKISPPSAPKNSDELLAMLLRATASESFSRPQLKPRSVFNSISSFLPFSSRRKAKTTVPYLEKPIPSHLPVPVDRPLSYLQAFSPLTYTSTVMLLPSETVSLNSASQDAERVAMQRHLINVSHPSGLFNSRLSMTVDTYLLSIASLEILKLDSAAEKELGIFVRSRSQDDTPLDKEITVVCWAMGRWVETSILRARLWCAIDHEFGTPEARMKSFQRKKKRKLPKMVTDDGDTVPLEGYSEEEESRKQKWTRRQLLPHMGRAAMEIATDSVELLFEWKIAFDWTGEVNSSISASARLPKSCMVSPSPY